MNRHPTRRLSLFARLSLLVCLSLSGCDNMWHQEHYRPYDPSAFFADGTSARRPPEHTIPVDQAPVTMPKIITLAMLQRGREVYRIQCSVCHGEDGYGDGIVVLRGFPAPPSFHQDRLRLSPSSHLYDVMMQGYGIMYPAGYRIPPSDRWPLIAYIRALQLSQHATLAAVPPSDRDSLAKRDSLHRKETGS